MQKTANFSHLHVHSHYSILDGLSKIDNLVQKAKNLGQKALAITDHGVMHGAFEFFNKAKAAGIKPIIGCEVYLAPNSMEGKTREDTNAYHLVLLAKNETGYKNLMHLVTEAHLRGYYYKPRIDKDLLAKHSDGLIALTACLQGEISRLILSKQSKKLKESLNFYKATFGKDFYLEVQHHPNFEDQEKVNQAIYKLAQEYKIKVVATQDSHYLNIDDQEAHEALLCVQTGTFVSDTNRMSMAMDHFHLTSNEEMTENFKDHPEVLTNTQEIVDKVNLEIKSSEKLLLPKFPLPDGYSPEKYLHELALRGLSWRYGGRTREEALSHKAPKIKVSKEISERLNYELSVVNETGYASYYLIVADFCNWAKDNDISVGPGRGSGAGSLIAYLVGITDIDPLKYGLIFERFLNPERISPPDFDIDLADDRRDEVIQYVREKYGVDRVAQICTFGKMESKQAVRDVARVLGYPYLDGDRIAKAIPFGLKLDQALAESRELQDMYEKEEKVQKIIDLAKRLEGVVRQVGIHAAGVVIAPENITNFVPLQKAPKGDLSIITQYEMHDIGDLGLVKMDFLGLSNLSIIQQALKVIIKLNNKEIDVESLPLEDKKTYELFAKGNTIGVFQFSSEGMRRYLRELKPTVFEDLIAMVALYRPGPMDSIPNFIAGKHGERQITYLDPKLKPILDKTYGVIVTQDQVLDIARNFAGFTYGEADILRKAVGKKIHKLLIEQKKKFIQGAVKNGATKNIAIQVWDFIEPFASYGFNKAHAAGYAMIAYINGYLKANYPSEFMSALLTADQEDLDKVARDIAECEALGIKVLPPDINKSFVEFGVDKDTGDISFALAAIKNIGETPAKIIVRERKKKGSFQNLEDFLKRLAPILNKKIIESLAKSGALDNFGERQQLLNNSEIILKFASALAKKGNNNQADLFGIGVNKLVEEKLNLEPADPASEGEKMGWERELLGIYLSVHPLDGYKKVMESFPYHIVDLRRMPENKEVMAFGVLSRIQKVNTRNGDMMLFCKLEDKTGSVELLVFPKVLEEFGESFQLDEVIGVKGRLSFKERGQKTVEPKIIVNRARRAKDIKINGKPKVDRPKREIKEKTENLYLSIAEYSKTLVESLKGILSQNYGKVPVYLIINDKGVNKELRLKEGVNLSDFLINDLKSLLGEESISLR